MIYMLYERRRAATPLKYIFQHKDVLPDVISFLGGQANGRGKRFYERNLSLPTSDGVASFLVGVILCYLG